ncbi:MAG: hypothetical protein ACTSO9_00930 [Candidatus Helarchaeota archaeon]
MIQFPISGDLREILLVIESLIFVLEFQFGLIFLRRFLQPRKDKNYMNLAWAFVLFGFSLSYFIFILADFYNISSDVRQNLIGIGYIIYISGMIFFSFNAEREIPLKNYNNTKILLVLLILLIFNYILPLIPLLIIAILCWPPFIYLIIKYVNAFTYDIKEKWRKNIYGFYIGVILNILGYGGVSDIITNTFGVGIRLLGDILIFSGMFFVNLFFMSLPALREFDWVDKIRDLYVMHDSGRCIYEYNFKEEETHTSSKVYPQLIAGGLTSITQAIAKLLESEEHLEVLDKGDVKLLFEYGKNVINVLIVDEVFETIKIKLKNFTKEIEHLYQDILPTWDGEISHFKLLGSIIQNNFGANER